MANTKEFDINSTTVAINGGRLRVVVQLPWKILKKKSKSKFSIIGHMTQEA
jgi:hypothetical protein